MIANFMVGREIELKPKHGKPDLGVQTTKQGDIAPLNWEQDLRRGLAFKTV